MSWALVLSIAGAGIEPLTLPAGTVTLTTGVPSGTDSEFFFKKNLLRTQSQKGKNIKNPVAEQRGSPQGCSVRPESSAGSSLGGI
jgi:hypothetical protein